MIENQADKIPDTPMFVTAFSSNHFREGLALLHNFKRFVRPVYQNSPLVVFNIGLTEEEQHQVSS